MTKDDVIKILGGVVAQPAQEPVAWQFMNGSYFRKRRPKDFSDLAPDGFPYWNPLYTTPPQRPWQEPTESEWFEWWRVSQVAHETEAEIDFADFLIIAQAVTAKLKERNA